MTATAISTAPIRRLLADLRAAGWRYSLDWHESGRDPDGAPEHEGWLIHRWTRPGGAAITLWRQVDTGDLYGGLSFYPFGEDIDDAYDHHVHVGIGWLRQATVRDLRRMAEALGVVPLRVAADMKDAVYDALLEAWPDPSLHSECNLSGQLHDLAGVAVDAVTYTRGETER